MSKNKKVIFCGGSSGLGKFAAIKFLNQGWDVINVDITSNSELETLGIKLYSCDVSDYNKTVTIFEKIFKDNSDVTTLINCIRYREDFNENHDFYQWNKSLRINLDTYYNSSRIFSEFIKTKQIECSIINFSSVLSTFISLHEGIGYHVAKAGIEQMTRYFAVLYGKFGIRVNSVMPGLISQQRSEAASSLPDASLYSKIAQYVPLKRSGNPEEVTDLLLFLASSSSSFITGQTICIDGGLSLRDPVDCIIPQM